MGGIQGGDVESGELRKVRGEKGREKVSGGAYIDQGGSKCVLTSAPCHIFMYAMVPSK